LFHLHACQSFHLFLAWHTFLLPFGMYSYTDLEMWVLFILSKCCVHLQPAFEWCVLFNILHILSIPKVLVLRLYQYSKVKHFFVINWWLGGVKCVLYHIFLHVFSFNVCREQP
jgi:hypothetical protein